jgi:hypothetical protein
VAFFRVGLDMSREVHMDTKALIEILSAGFATDPAETLRAIEVAIALRLGDDAPSELLALAPILDEFLDVLDRVVVELEGGCAAPTAEGGGE